MKRGKRYRRMDKDQRKEEGDRKRSIKGIDIIDKKRQKKEREREEENWVEKIEWQKRKEGGRELGKQTEGVEGRKKERQRE